MPPFPKLCEPVTIVLHVVLPEMHGEVCEPLRACPRDVEVADIPDDRGRVGEPAEVPKFVFDGWVEVRIGGRGSRAEFNMGGHPGRESKQTFVSTLQDLLPHSLRIRRTGPS